MVNTAHAGESPSPVNEVAASVADAVNALGVPVPASNADVHTSLADGSTTLATRGGNLTMRIPSQSSGRKAKDGLTTVFDGVGDTSSVAIQPTREGVRAAISIDSPTAPEKYRFELGGAVRSLALNSDGSVTALDADGQPIASADAPWAVDANGTNVPTYYAVEGTTLIQVVEHNGGNYAYGIIADPWWNPFSWPWGKWVKKSASVVGAALKKCGVGALKNTLGLGSGQSR